MFSLVYYKVMMHTYCVGSFEKVFCKSFSFFCRTASGGAQGAAANGAVEGREKPSGPPSVRHTFLFKKFSPCPSLFKTRSEAETE